jgi:tetratricopeptide (TPR) repeat protein
MRRSGLAILVALGCLCWVAPRGFAQASELDKGPAPPPAEAPPPEPPKPQFDPVRAHKDLEIGSYYLKTDNINAAIDRLQEAADLQPGLAEPFRLLGKAYERKHQPQQAVSAYQKYLRLYPNAPDHNEVQKQIEKLNDELQGQARR